MKRLLLLLLFAVPLVAEDQPCMIIKHHKKTVSESLSRWTVAKPFNYVEGEFPKGTKFRSELNDKHVREIQAAGTRVVVLPDSYSIEQLNDARARCKENK